MGSLAVLAKQLGHEVSGSDANVYPPMSTQLEAQGITLGQGYNADNLKPDPDLVVIGNAMSRGNPAVEYVLERNLPYCSGPEFLSRWVLPGRWVLGAAGTHGKTTTSSMLAWILEYAGLKPGYLIGGVAKNFPSSATLGESPFFVVEADEYDTAFFDKRSKFIHYAPRTAILNNLEFDHGDIFEDLAAIQKQFHHLVRTVPPNGLLLYGYGETNIEQVLDMGCWTPVQQYGVNVDEKECESIARTGAGFWNANLLDEHGSHFEVVKYAASEVEIVISEGEVQWDMTGIHNVKNALAAIAAAHHAGVAVSIACEALNEFEGVKRRMELRGEVNGIKVFDDFAHHPTAIASTLQGIAAKLEQSNKPSRLIAVIEPRSNTMKMGVHQAELAAATNPADLTLWKQADGAGLDLDQVIAGSRNEAKKFTSTDDIISYLATHCTEGDQIVVMSNGGFDGIHQKLLDALSKQG
jgi:UDP-N-acetylmuramate: L-alanyl-gamma-D-glutamyl-meso-diaminopimelate ligase